MASSKLKKRRAKLIQVLEYMDGPQAILLDRGGDQFVVAVAIEKEGMENPFFGAAISHDQWEDYKGGFCDLRYLFLLPRWREWFIFDLAKTENGTVGLEKSEKTDQAEEQFLPEKGFFAYHHSEPVHETANEGLSVQHYATDGRWRLPEMGEFTNKIADIYVFFLALKKFVTEQVPDNIKKLILDTFSGQPYRGGSSYVNLFSDLRAVQTPADRFATGKFKYESPGYLEVEGRADVFRQVAHSLARFQSDYETLKSKYNELYNYLQKNELLKADADKFDKKGPIADFVKLKADELAECLGLSDAKTIYTLTTKNSLLFAKVVLAQFRRLDSYFIFFAEGRIEEPTTIEKKM